MHDGDILILKGQEAAALLAGRENELIDIVRRAYEAHTTGDSSLPHSTFLHFPNEPRQRIIALPAFLGGDFGVAGIKWVASFPSNLEKGMDRASAVVILNSTQTGRPQVIIEGSIINAKRTAASAALAARFLQDKQKASRVGIIGCGFINFEVVRFLLASSPEINELVLFDLDTTRANKFKDDCRKLSAEISIQVVKDIGTVLKSTTLVSLATTALKPHIDDLSMCAPSTTLLHVSLRDLSPEVILSSDNIVDDISHVCRANTSVHLTEQLVGHREFIRCTLGDVTLGNATPRRDAESIAVFSPFGLGILDIAVGQYIYELARRAQQGTVIESFLPEPWSARDGQSH
ncbi:MAG TPA: 2,3-diaminopropionate biosynthesis protein SbnB [Pyrinomonadaceae bacterium]|jgi:ornithine cyclodeaminase